MNIGSFDWIAKAKQSQTRLEAIMAQAAEKFSNAGTGSDGDQFEIAVRQLVAHRGVNRAEVQSAGKVDQIAYMAGTDGKKHRSRIEIKSGSGIVAQLEPELGLRSISDFSEADILPDVDLVIYAAKPAEFETLDDLLDGTAVLARIEFIKMVEGAGGKRKSGFETCFSVQCNSTALVKRNKELPAVVEIVDRTTGSKVKVPTTREIVDKKTGETKITRRGCPRWTDCIVMQTSYVDSRAEAVELGLAMGEMVSLRTWLEDNGRA